MRHCYNAEENGAGMDDAISTTSAQLAAALAWPGITVVEAHPFHLSPCCCSSELYQRIRHLCAALLQADTGLNAQERFSRDRRLISDLLRALESSQQGAGTGS